ncbi:hypothetical protein ABT104_06180 [Streptomyces mobaraensis]|uniref:hypothetical protein n=1 Tax=Streptomyces mobaraensis TaxID=35621 RepID=UPI003326E7AA
MLGSAGSEEPLILPMEAIEVDAFRRRHEHDTFWCGQLLGGCGGRLTTKLYTDRVCHFAHHPDPSGLPHLCGRQARGVSSADHLYMKAAASTWLEARGLRAAFHYARPGGAPVGSVVDIVLEHGGGALRVHLDTAVAPAWDDEGIEPVLGLSVPVDAETLVRRWYVHRVRFDSVGTARRVRIGTEAFARETEWFALDDCAMTDEGLRTPAVERIIRSRRTPAPRALGHPTAADTVSGMAERPESEELLRQLADARRTESMDTVEALCRRLKRSGLPEREQAAAAALKEARAWLSQRLERLAEERRALFGDLRQAIDERRTGEVPVLLARADATAGRDRSREEDAIASAAAAFLDDLKRSARWEQRDSAPPVRGPKFSRIPSRYAPPADEPFRAPFDGRTVGGAPQGAGSPRGPAATGQAHAGP